MGSCKLINCLRPSILETGQIRLHFLNLTIIKPNVIPQAPTQLAKHFEKLSTFPNAEETQQIETNTTRVSHSTYLVMESSVVSELEGTLLKDWDPFSYFMLVAFEASGLIRFALLLILWPLIRVLEMVGMGEAGLKLMVFVAVAGVPESEIETVARSVLPKFMMDDLDMDAWEVFSSYDKRVVVSRMPKIMVERFVKEHLRADEVIGTQLCVNRFGFATGLVEADSFTTIYRRVAELFNKDAPALGMGRPTASTSSFLQLCKVSRNL